MNATNKTTYAPDDPKKKGLKGQADQSDCSIGQRLKELRKAQSLTQKDIANALSVSSQQIQKYEKGQDRISFGRITELSKFMNLPIENFTATAGLSDNEQAPLTPPANSTLSTKEQQDILDIFALFSTDKRKDVIKFMRAMATEDNS